MSTTKVLCFYHPTTVVIVDDNQPFLDSIVDNLSDDAKYQLFDSPKKALKFLDEQRKNLLVPEDFLGEVEDPLTSKFLNVNISKIYARIVDKKYFETPTVVIVDYDMPGMSGIEFCEALDDYPIKKVMLTGAADHKLAVKAFNDCVINKFISKDDPNVFSLINQGVYELQHEHFAALSDVLIKNITMTTSSFLTNKAYQKFLMQFVKENDIAEFYLTDAIGSFLLRDVRGNVMRLIAQSAQEIENYRRVAEDHDAPSKMLDALANREQLVCLFSDDDFNQPIETWDAYLHKAHQSEGVEGLYYTILREEAVIKTIEALVK